MTPTPDDIFRTLYEALGVLCPVLPSVKLSSAQIMSLSGRATRGAPRLVRAVSQALEDAPDAFAAVPADLADLRARQERAFAYFTAYAALQRLAEQARAHYLVEQGAVQRDAMLVVHFAPHQLAAPVPSAHRHRITMAMLGPEACVAAERGPRGRRQPAGERAPQTGARRTTRKPRRPGGDAARSPSPTMRT